MKYKVLIVSLIFFLFAFIAGCSKDEPLLSGVDNYICVDDYCLSCDDYFRAVVKNDSGFSFMYIETDGQIPGIISAFLVIHIYNANLDSIPQAGAYPALPLDYHHNYPPSIFVPNAARFFYQSSLKIKFI